jgi:hypothetical protein
MPRADCAHHSIIRSIVNTDSVDICGEAKALQWSRIRDGGVATFTSPAKFAMEDSIFPHHNIAINGLQSALLDTCRVHVSANFVSMNENDAAAEETRYSPGNGIEKRRIRIAMLLPVLVGQCLSLKHICPRFDCSFEQSCSSRGACNGENWS